MDAEHGAEGPVLWEEHGAWFAAEKDLELPLHQHSGRQWGPETFIWQHLGSVGRCCTQTGGPCEGTGRGLEYHQEQKKQCH